MDSQQVATTYPPAKLNLFLELLRKRSDGYHDIDTVMAAISWRDRIRLSRTDSDQISLRCRWSPSARIAASQLSLGDASDSLIALPEDNRNLVHIALSRFKECFQTDGGFKCDLTKRIPAGAGMGGASSNAASALLCAAALCGIPAAAPELLTIASSIGSDVPFFLGTFAGRYSGTTQKASASLAARATGTGTEISPVHCGFAPHLVVAFPGKSLSTARVYLAAKIPDSATSADEFVNGWKSGNQKRFADNMLNRLSKPAEKLVPEIGDLIDSMWQYGAKACQLTGSGSACFAVTHSAITASRIAKRIQNRSTASSDSHASSGNAGVWSKAVSVVKLPAKVEVCSSKQQMRGE